MKVSAVQRVSLEKHTKYFLEFAYPAYLRMELYCLLHVDMCNHGEAQVLRQHIESLLYPNEFKYAIWNSQFKQETGLDLSLCRHPIDELRALFEIKQENAARFLPIVDKEYPRHWSGNKFLKMVLNYAPTTLGLASLFEDVMPQQIVNQMSDEVLYLSLFRQDKWFPVDAVVTH